jgi:hypothetical protein
MLAVLITLGVYLLSDGKFLFIPILFLPALPFFRRQQSPPQARDARRRDIVIPPPPTASEERRFDEVQLPPAGSIEPPKSDPRWN